ncbi:MAG: RDD family protein [Acidimicrobiales bacterium]
MSDSTRDKPTAVLGRRYLAYLIDLLVHLAVVAVPFFLLGEKARDSADTTPFADAYRLNPFYAVRVDDQVWLFTKNDLITIGAVSAAFVILVTVIIQGRLGWTIGKALTGLRTVNRDGGPAGILRALGRTILLVIDAIPSWVIPIVGPLIALFTSDNRRLGDLACGTYVVHKSAVGNDPTGDRGPSAWEPRTDDAAPLTTLAESDDLRVGGAAAVGEPAPEEATDEKAPAYQPQWDPARQAYLQWDPRKQQWLQYDEAAGEWHPIG